MQLIAKILSRQSKPMSPFSYTSLQQNKYAPFAKSRFYFWFFNQTIFVSETKYTFVLPKKHFGADNINREEDIHRKAL